MTLAKLMKYDIKKMMRILVYIYVIGIVLAIITRVVNIWSEVQVAFIIGQVFTGCTFSAIASILVNAVVHILRVFIKDFYRDESYLIHTLPVTKSQLLLSKYLSSLFTIFASVAVSFLCVVIMFFSPEFFEGLKFFIQETIAGFNMSIGGFIVIFVLSILVQICVIIMMSFTAIIKANSYNSKKIVKGILWFALYYLGSMVVTILVAVIAFAITGNLSELSASVLSQSAFITIFVLALIMYVIYAILFYFICDKMFNKGVNVD